MLAAVLVALVAATLAFTSLSGWERSCSACHTTAITALEDGAHGGIECRACHRGDSMAEVVDFRFRMAAMAPAVIGVPYSPRPVVASARCLECHAYVLDEVVVAEGIRMSHAAPHRSGYACVDCHAASPHGSADRPGIAMDECLRCHVVSALSQDCGTCHVGTVTRDARQRTGTFAITHGSEWVSSHGAGDLRTCTACHTAARCESCHGVPVPHGDQWMNEHGVASRTAECLSCHAEEFCTGCHGLEIPHPDGFLAVHSAEVEALGAETCDTCHASSGCDACHTRHAHPGLTPERVERLRRKAGLDE